jgi:hypothetical protein
VIRRAPRSTLDVAAPCDAERAVPAERQRPLCRIQRRGGHDVIPQAKAAKGSYYRGGNVRVVLVVLGFSALSPLAHGGEKISFDGVQYASGHFQAVQLEPNHTYLLVKEWRAIHVSKDAANITNGTRLECTGFIDAKPDGTFNSDGYCNHWDKDGHLWVGHWWNNSKMNVGRYEVVGGQGKYAGATGGGTANCKFLNPPPDPQAACEITGTIELK